MAPKTPDTNNGSGETTKQSESAKQLLSLLAYINGTIDFDGYARDQGIPTIEAARKRVKRAITANNLSVTTNGDRIGSGLAAEPSTATPRKSNKRKNVDDSGDVEVKSPPANKTPKSAKKVRFAKNDDEEDASGDAAHEE